jgi:hypothetical protein
MFGRNQLCYALSAPIAGAVVASSDVMHTVADLCTGRRPGLPLELFRKRLVVEEGPWIVEFVIPRPL